MKRYRALAVLAFGAALQGCGSSVTATVAPQPAQDCAVLQDAGEVARPQTIPALRVWAPGDGAFVLGATPAIRMAPGQAAALLPVAEVLAADLALIAGRTATVIEGGAASPGDIALDLDECDARVGTEGYRLRIGATFAISARAAAGAFYGTRSLLQLLRQPAAPAAGEALDWPRYPQRGLMVDVGRKYFTPGWIEQHIRELAWLKLNLLHLHLSDDQGFRIESERHPEIVSAEHLRKGEVRALVALAARYHITVVPEIDMPGHLGAALAAHPEWQLVDLLGRPAPTQLDVTNPEARAFARELIEEYLPLFPGPYWHLGGDEYMAPYDYPLYPQLRSDARERYGAQASGKDAIHGFINEMAGVVQAAGKTARMWHDDLNGGSAVTVDPAIIVEWWTNFSPLSDPLPPGPRELLDRGHQILNAGWFPNYYTTSGYVPGPIIIPFRPDMKEAYEDWSVDQFSGPLYLPPLAGETIRFPEETIPADEPRNLGAKLHVWCDDPAAESEAEIAAGIAPRLRVLAQKTWASPQLTDDYAAFRQIEAAIGHDPGYTLP